MNWHLLVEIVGVVVTVASVLAKVVPEGTIFGKAVHFIALNGPRVRRAAQAAEDATLRQ